MLAENRTSIQAPARGSTALRDLFLPLGTILLTSVSAIAALLIVIAQRADREAPDNLLQLAGPGTGYLEKGLADIAKGLGWWDDAIDGRIVSRARTFCYSGYQCTSDGSPCC